MKRAIKQEMRISSSEPSKRYSVAFLRQFNANMLTQHYTNELHLYHWHFSPQATYLTIHAVHCDHKFSRCLGILSRLYEIKAGIHAYFHRRTNSYRAVRGSLVQGMIDSLLAIDYGHVYDK